MLYWDTWNLGGRCACGDYTRQAPLRKVRNRRLRRGAQDRAALGVPCCARAEKWAADRPLTRTTLRRPHRTDQDRYRLVGTPAAVQLPVTREGIGLKPSDRLLGIPPC